jgi:hypothetical protein
MTRTVWLLGMALLLGLVAGRANGQPPPAQPLTKIEDLKRLSPAQLEQLFCVAEVGPLPLGFVRGEVLFLPDARRAEFRTWASNLVWKGKHFDEAGNFINQFVCFRAIRSTAALGTSYYDGKPCVVLQYPEGTMFLGAMRDEVRQIRQGLYLAMVFEKEAPHRFQGFIGLELQPEKNHKAH